jgi:hypothetical protein
MLLDDQVNVPQRNIPIVSGMSEGTYKGVTDMLLTIKLIFCSATYLMLAGCYRGVAVVLEGYREDFKRKKWGGLLDLRFGVRQEGDERRGELLLDQLLLQCLQGRQISNISFFPFLDGYTLLAQTSTK